jgi:hypothetical protein
MAKNGRNDPCPCGSGKKYKKCCMIKDQESAKKAKKTPGLWTDDLCPENEYYNTMEEFYSEIRSTGRIAYVIGEYSDDGDEFGSIHTIEVGELCKHGQPCACSATFEETDDGRWESIEGGYGTEAPCMLCEIVKEGIEIGCPECGLPLPEFTENEIREIHRKGIEFFDIKCSCGSKFIIIDDEGVHIHPPKKESD